MYLENKILGQASSEEFVELCIPLLTCWIREEDNYFNMGEIDEEMEIWELFSNCVVGMIYVF